jgi:predicted transcriptional regulator
MEVKISPELEAKLGSIATQQGRALESLVREAVEQFVRHAEWFHKRVDEGLAQVDSHETLSHEQIALATEDLIARKQRRS